MRALLLSDVELSLRHLLVEKNATLQNTAAGRLYVPRLTAYRSMITALPESDLERRQLVATMVRTDSQYNASGAAIWHYIESVLRAPDIPPKERSAAVQIREAFVPQLSILNLSYATKAAHAEQRRPRISELAIELERFSVPGHSTLAAWVESFVSAGEALGEQLVVRAKLHPTGGLRAEAPRLRTETIGLLMRLRAALADEFADDPATLREYDAELFGFIDELVARREQSLSRRATPAEEDPEVEVDELPAVASERSEEEPPKSAQPEERSARARLAS